MIGCVVCNGEIHDYGRAKSQIRSAGLVVAADGGSTHLEVMGIVPHAIIGDMDSVGRAWWPEGEPIERVRFPPDKDKSDAELAIDLAFERGCDSVSLLGATGGRLDHELGNVSLLAKYAGRVAIVDGGATLVAVAPSHECALRGKPGAIVSLIPFPAAERVTTHGLEYGLVSHDLTPGTRGVSNVLLESKASVSVRGGLLLVYMENTDS